VFKSKLASNRAMQLGWELNNVTRRTAISTTMPFCRFRVQKKRR
jgi:hypothetical protein